MDWTDPPVLPLCSFEDLDERTRVGKGRLLRGFEPAGRLLGLLVDAGGIEKHSGCRACWASFNGGRNCMTKSQIICSDRLLRRRDTGAVVVCGPQRTA